jgi:putative membrane protein
MIKQCTYLVALASLTLLFAGSATTAQNKTPTSNRTNAAHRTTAATHKLSDAEFAKRSAEGGMAEVKLGQLAEDKGTIQAVKDFGKRMMADHRKADDELNSAASKDKIVLPSDLDARHQATYDRLSKLSGEAFDRAYARLMVRDHRTDVFEFRSEATEGKDAPVKSFATQTLPMLENHLRQARELLHTVSAANTTHKTGTAHIGA